MVPRGEGRWGGVLVKVKGIKKNRLVVINVLADIMSRRGNTINNIIKTVW